MPGKATQLPSLPGPVLFRVFTYLSPDDISKCRQICILWNQVIKYYKLVPNLSNFFVHFGSLKKFNPSFQSSWSLHSTAKHVLLNLLKPKLAATTLQFLQDAYLRNSVYYFERDPPRIRLVAFEEMSSFNFLSPGILPTLSYIHILDLQVVNISKFKKMRLEGFQVMLSSMHRLQKLCLPLRLLSAVDHMKLKVSKDPCFFCLRSLKIILPEMTENSTEYIKAVSNLCLLITSSRFQNLQRLQLYSEPVTIIKNKGWSKKKLRAVDVNNYFSEVDKIMNTLDTSLSQNFTTLKNSKLFLRNLTLKIQDCPMSVFKQTGFIHALIELVLRGLRNLSLYLQGSVLDKMLPLFFLVLDKFDLKMNDVDLHLQFYLSGNENQALTQYILSFPEVYGSVRSLSIRFLADYEASNHMFFLEDFIPFNSNLDEAEGQVLFRKLETFKIQYEKPTLKVFLTFGWLRTIWPSLKHVSIIVGHPEDYESERSIGWTMLKDKWKGRRSTSVSNIFYLRGIIKFFPKLETLLFWGDLTKANDHVLVPIYIGRPYEQFKLTECIPELRKMSLRGLGPNVTNNSIRGFYGLPNLTHLELIGNHSITSLSKPKLLEETPTLKQIKFKM